MALDVDRVVVSQSVELRCGEFAVRVIELMEIMYRSGFTRYAAPQRFDIPPCFESFFARQKTRDVATDLCAQGAHGRDSTSMLVEPVGKENQSPSTPTRMGPS